MITSEPSGQLTNRLRLRLGMFLRDIIQELVNLLGDVNVPKTSLYFLYSHQLSSWISSCASFPLSSSLHLLWFFLDLTAQLISSPVPERWEM